MVQLASDNFNRANGGLGSNWTVFSGLGTLSIVSNEVEKPVNGSHQYEAYTGYGTVDDDQWAECVIVNAETGSGEGSGPAVRGNTGSTNYYMIQCDTSGWHAWKRTPGGGWSNWWNYSSATISDGDTIRYEIEGTTHRVYINGVQEATNTDSSISSGYPGMGGYNGAGAVLYMDDFAMGDLSAGGPPQSQLEVQNPKARVRPYTREPRIDRLRHDRFARR